MTTGFLVPHSWEVSMSCPQMQSVRLGLSQALNSELKLVKFSVFHFSFLPLQMCNG